MSQKVVHFHKYNIIYDNIASGYGILLDDIKELLLVFTIFAFNLSNDERIRLPT